MQINTTSICSDLLAIQLEDGVLDLSWTLDTDTLRDKLRLNNISKILNFQQNIDFVIEIDNNVDEIYFYTGNKGYKKVLEKTDDGTWNIIIETNN